METIVTIGLACRAVDLDRPRLRERYGQGRMIRRPSIVLAGTVVGSKPARQRVFTDHPEKGCTPAASSSGVGGLGRRKGRMPHTGQK